MVFCGFSLQFGDTLGSRSGHSGPGRAIVVHSWLSRVVGLGMGNCESSGTYSSNPNLLSEEANPGPLAVEGYGMYGPRSFGYVECSRM